MVWVVSNQYSVFGVLNLAAQSETTPSEGAVRDYAKRGRSHRLRQANYIFTFHFSFFTFHYSFFPSNFIPEASSLTVSTLPVSSRRKETTVPPAAVNRSFSP